MRLTMFSDLGLRALMILGSTPDSRTPSPDNTNTNPNSTDHPNPTNPGTTAPAPTGALTVAQLAEQTRASHHHMARVVAALAEMGLVESRRGRGGGVRLHPSAHDASVGKVLRALEAQGTTSATHPADNVVDCAGELNCPLAQGDCALRHRLAAATEAFFATLDGDTIGDLIHSSTLPNPISNSTTPHPTPTPLPTPKVNHVR